MKLGPVGGIFNLAVVLRDSIFENQDVDKFNECMAPKAVATKHLDEVSRVLCPELQYFVVFSSVSCGRGNAGQSNYGMANSVMERIMEQRHSLGLPAKAIQWGAVGEVGLVADMQEDKLDMEIGGTLQQRISSCLEVMDPLMTVDEPLVSSMVVAEKRFSATKSGNVLETIMNIMGIRDLKSISMETTLSELGMDSLMTVEIQQTLEREFDLVISAQDLRTVSLTKLVESANSLKTTKDDADTSKAGVGMMLRNLGDESDSGTLLLQVTEAENSKRANVIIPGMEGVAGDLWKDLAKILEGKSFLLQHKNTVNSTSINSSVEEMFPNVFKLFEGSQTFNILGYSYGSLYALKIASLLEAKGKRGNLLLVDGSPFFLKKLLIDQVEKINSNWEEILEVMVLNGVTDLVMPNKNHEVIECMHSKLSWTEKVDKILKMSKNFNVYSETYVKNMINVLLNNTKIMYTLNFEDFPVLTNTKVKLVRPKDGVLKDIEKDYELSRLCKQPIDVRFINGNHITMLDNPEIREIMKEFNE
jgi:fatty acid synthase, animal type